MSAHRHDGSGAATLRALLDRAAAQWPAAPFLIAAESARTISYAEMRALAAATAADLARRGLARGDTVCLAMDSGLRTTARLLGAMYGGFVPVPLNLGAGPSELAYIVRHCDATLMLAAEERRALVEPAVRAADRRIDLVTVAATDPDRIEPGPAAPPLPALRSDDDAVLMYTSGSTGQPKGVLMSHGNLAACAAGRAAAHELECADRALCVLPSYHNSSLSLLLAVLYSGGSAVVPRRFSVAPYWNWVIDHHCTWLALVPTIVSQLLAWAEPTPAAARDRLRAVRFARCSSAPLPDAVHRAFEERFGVLLVQGMGMTETGGIFLNPPRRDQRKVGSLGRAHAFEVKISAADGSALAAGEAGEIIVRGASVMKGYYKDPEATAQVLDGTGWLRTGDLGVRDEDGYIFHVGRVKELIIKAGTNVAPRQVDEALESHPDVVEAAAVGVSDPYLGEDIVAFAVRRAGARCSEKDLLDHCERRVGPFKTPSRITFVPALPRLPGGKLERRELSRRAALAVVSPVAVGSPLRSSNSTAPFTEPQTPLEATVAAVWAEQLGTARVGIDDDYFALGGTSLLAVQILSRLRQALGVQLSVGTFLGAPTVRTQAALFAERQHDDAADILRPIDPEGNPLRASIALVAPCRPQSGRAALFCVYGSLRFRPLAQRLGREQPVYGVSLGFFLDPDADSAGAVPRVSVEALARHHVAELRRIQPMGPYQLLGFSFGGRVALEMAHQLVAAEQAVPLLVILDTNMPGTFRRRLLPWLARNVRESLRGGPRYVLDRLRGRGQPMGAAADALPIGDLVRPEAEFRTWIRSTHRPKPFAGKVVLFRAIETYRWHPADYRVDRLLGWAKLARGGLEVYDVPGPHDEVVSASNLAVIADALRPHLAAARDPSAASLPHCD